MTAGPWVTYNHTPELLMKNTIDGDLAGHFRAVLLSSSYTADRTHTAWSSLSAAQLTTANGYTANGFALTQTVTRSGATTTFDCDDPTWVVTGSALAARYVAIIYDANGDGTLAAGDYPIAYALLDATPADYSVSPGNSLVVQINSAGVFTIGDAA